MFEIKTTDEFEDWLEGLKDRQASAKVLNQLDRMALGNFGDVKPVGEGVSETRINYGPGYRIYHYKAGKTIIVVLAGGTKSRQDKDIKSAKAIRNSYEKT